MKLWEEYNITEEQVKSLRLPWEVYHGHATVIYPDVEGLCKKMMVYVVRYDEGYTYFRFPVGTRSSGRWILKAAQGGRAAGKGFLPPSLPGVMGFLALRKRFDRAGKQNVRCLPLRLISVHQTLPWISCF